MQAWLTEIHEYAQKDVVIMLLGNKVSGTSWGGARATALKVKIYIFLLLLLECMKLIIILHLNKKISKERVLYIFFAQYERTSSDLIQIFIRLHCGLYHVLF